MNPRHRGSSDEIIVEHVGANMGIQIPLLVIGRRDVSVLSAWFPNLKGLHTKGSVTLELLWEIVCCYRRLYGVPDEIPDVTRSSRMVRR